MFVFRFGFGALHFQTLALSPVSRSLATLSLVLSLSNSLPHFLTIYPTCSSFPSLSLCLLCLAFLSSNVSHCRGCSFTISHIFLGIIPFVGTVFHVFRCLADACRSRLSFSSVSIPLSLSFPSSPLFSTLFALLCCGSLFSSTCRILVCLIVCGDSFMAGWTRLFQRSPLPISLFPKSLAHLRSCSLSRAQSILFALPFRPSLWVSPALPLPCPLSRLWIHTLSYPTSPPDRLTYCADYFRAGILFCVFRCITAFSAYR